MLKPKAQGQGPPLARRMIISRNFNWRLWKFPLDLHPAIRTFETDARVKRHEFSSFPPHQGSTTTFTAGVAPLRAVRMVEIDMRKAIALRDLSGFVEDRDGTG